MHSIIGPADYYDIVIDLMDYFVQEEGWKQEYAHQVLAKQCSDLGQELRRRREGRIALSNSEERHRIAEEGIDYFRTHADSGEYRELIEKLCTILSPYKRPDSVEHMRRRLSRIIARYINK